MNRISKIAAKSFLGLLFLIVIAIIVSYWYISTEWKKYYTESEVREFAKTIENSPSLSNNFYAIYDKLNNNDRHKSIRAFYTNTIWNEMILGRHKTGSCWFVNAARPFVFTNKRKNKRYPDFTLAWGLEKYTTAEKCFDFAKQIENMALLSMQKDTLIRKVSTLNDTTEILEYIIKSRAPSYYNRNPEVLAKRVYKLKELLKE